MSQPVRHEVYVHRSYRSPDARRRVTVSSVIGDTVFFEPMGTDGPAPAYVMQLDAFLLNYAKEEDRRRVTTNFVCPFCNRHTCATVGPVVIPATVGAGLRVVYELGDGYMVAAKLFRTQDGNAVPNGQVGESIHTCDGITRK